jgi:acyl-coenzyme A synthetase/AMP-(fatty) acid ligase
MAENFPNPGFVLIENGKSFSTRDFQSSAGVIDVGMAGTKGVIDGLLAAQAGGEIWLTRDISVSPEIKKAIPGSVHLQTSGTTGKPKWVAHDLVRLASKISGGREGSERARWLLTFNPGSFAGVQVILSAMIGGHDLVAPAYGASVGEMADLAVKASVRNLSATPTFWRAFLMALGDRPLDLKSLTLGGEAADQAILDALRVRFPAAHIRHIYATTEAGTVFSVNDGRAGFPKAWLDKDLNGLRLSVSEKGTLQVANPRASDLAKTQVWDTGDVVELTEDRVLFRGRADSMVNVGGVKVYPESVESLLLELPFIQDVRILAKPNPITGHILTADILLKPFSGQVEELANLIRAHLTSLPRAFRPASLRFVDALEVGATGKKLRI